MPQFVLNVSTEPQIELNISTVPQFELNISTVPHIVLNISTVPRFVLNTVCIKSPYSATVSTEYPYSATSVYYSELILSVLFNLARYRWAFIGTAGEENKGCSNENAPKQKDQPRFTPHIVRLARLLNARVREIAVLMSG